MDTPKIGDLATWIADDCQYPFIVDHLSPYGSVLLIGLEPASSAPVRYDGYFPVFDAEGDPARRTSQRLWAEPREDGTWIAGGLPLVFGRAHYFINYANHR